MAPTTNLQRQETSLEDIIDSCLADSTTDRYESGLRQLVKWIHVTGATDLLKDNGSIYLRFFQYHHFVQFIVWVYQNTPVKVGTISGYRAALRWYYKREDVPMPTEYESKLKTIFTGMQRLTATDAQSSSVKDSGKRRLGFSMYESLCSKSLAAVDSGFVHLFLVISWNLMARSKSTETIQLDHISFEEDAVGITYCKSKTDQAGTKRRDPRHVYANPSSPAVCAFLAFGNYFACNPTLTSGALFPGARQRDRFGKALKTLVLSVFGDNAEGAVGTHSIRKGAATFVCSGSTSGPSVISVCLRCGWSLGNVVERYMHYEKAGDQFVGRVVAGLPLNSAGYAQLPPHFISTDDAIVASAVRCMFPGLSKSIAIFGVLKLSLASLLVWGGRLHKLPETFVFPSVDTATAWALWWLGKDNEVPYKTIDPDDLATKKQKRILSEWRYIMNNLWQFYVTENRTTEPTESTEEAIVEAFECAVHALDPVAICS
ncbi:hypothetical protein DYB36_013962 [Aphanomyces astaci]|uniref:Core-binding (CB) domain-containing protein n=1 Tax=Aphanomyces astaci TaxID=112090 RepID=A0A396ZVQ0_APHAT|nr:hypothetical protein DYB36_013962 [Aphanomyces astaci]